MALKEHYQERVDIIVADLDYPETERLLAEFEIYYIPAFVYINSDGYVVGEEAGVFDFEEMVEKVDRIALAEGAPVPGVADAEEDVAGQPGDEESEGGLGRFFSETLPEVVGERSVLTLVIVFFGGIVTSISPCILSMVPLLVSYIGAYGEGNRSRGFILSSSFVAGLAVTFAILGFIAAYFGRVFGQVGVFWYYILAAVAIIMGLQLIGVLTFNLPGLQKIPVRKAGMGGSLIMGMLFGLVASPCATPVLAVIITYAAVQGEPVYGSLLLFIYGLGHGLPLLIAGTFTGLARNLPRINRYTQYLSYASGFILILLGLGLLAWISWS